MVIVLMVLGVPLAYAAAFVLKLRESRRRINPDRCATCNYSMSGLSNAARCPECGSPPGVPPPRRRVRRDWYITFGATAFLAPVIVATMQPSVLVLGILTWTIASGIMGACLRIVDGFTAPRATMALAISLCIPALIGVAWTVGSAAMFQAGRWTPGEYGPEFDIALGTVFAGPLITTVAACWLFALTAGIVLWSGRPSRAE